MNIREDGFYYCQYYYCGKKYLECFRLKYHSYSTTQNVHYIDCASKSYCEPFIPNDPEQIKKDLSFAPIAYYRSEYDELLFDVWALHQTGPAVDSKRIYNFSNVGAKYHQIVDDGITLFDETFELEFCQC